MRYLDVCAGISASTVAWSPLGWKAAAYSEIEAAPRAVLAHHYPDTPLHGDFTTIQGDEYGPIDLLVGGTPCQDFSVAGLRAGLDGDRGNLSLEFLRLADRARPRWLVWENVPGVLSIDGGRAFGAILGGLVELGYGFAYRVLDAQHFGVPQRRRRVFVVGCAGDWRRAAAVLLERHSLSGHPAPRREAGEVAPTIPSRSLGGGGLGTDFDCDGGLIAGALTAHAFSGGAGGRPEGAAAGHFVAATVSAKWAKGSGGPSGDECQNLVAVAQVTHALRGEGFDASEDGTGRGTPIIPTVAPIAFSAKDHGGDAMTDCAPTLRAGGHSGSRANAGVMPAIAYGLSPDTFDRDGEGANGTAGERSGLGVDVELAYALRAKRAGGVATTSAVRRLTPRECERLQGFPDDYTLVPHRGKPMADGPRYKALGNSMAVPVMRWIGERIAAVDAL